MKSKKIAKLAILAGLIAGINSPILMAEENSAPVAEETDKNSCSGKEGCGSKDKASCNSKEKSSCSGESKEKSACNSKDKESCSGKSGCDSKVK